MATNVPIPEPMDTKGDLPYNWQFFRQQWTDFEIATGLNKKEKAVRMATLRSCLGKECLRIFQALRICDEDKNDPKKSTRRLGSIFQAYSQRGL